MRFWAKWFQGKPRRPAVSSRDAKLWAETLREYGDWRTLAAVFQETDFSADSNLYDRRRRAEDILLAAGSEVVDALIEQLKRGGGMAVVARILTRSNDKRAVRPLLQCFNDVGITSSGGAQDEIVEFCKRVDAKEAAIHLLQYVRDRHSGTRCAAAYGLGLLCDSETVEPLKAALNASPEWVRQGLRRAAARTSFAKDVLVEWEAQLRAGGPRIDSMSEQDMLTILRKLCTGYASSSSGESMSVQSERENLEFIARDIGEEMNRRGGIGEMKRLHGQLGGIPGARTLEMLWSGIGQWLG